jgi:hypothetical protein
MSDAPKRTDFDFAERSARLARVARERPDLIEGACRRAVERIAREDAERRAAFVIIHHSEDADALERTADTLDRLWEFDAARGARDSLGSAEYVRVSDAPRLRDMAERFVQAMEQAEAS